MCVCVCVRRSMKFLEPNLKLLLERASSCSRLFVTLSISSQRRSSWRPRLFFPAHCLVVLDRAIGTIVLEMDYSLGFTSAGEIDFGCHTNLLVIDDSTRGVIPSGYVVDLRRGDEVPHGWLSGYHGNGCGEAILLVG